MFESVFELKPAFDILFKRPDKLALVTDEMHSECSRSIAAQNIQGEAVMEGVEHLGKYVYDMQNAKLEAMKANGGQLPTREVKMIDANVPPSKVEVEDVDDAVAANGVEVEKAGDEMAVDEDAPLPKVGEAVEETENGNGDEEIDVKVSEGNVDQDGDEEMDTKPGVTTLQVEEEMDVKVNARHLEIEETTTVTKID